MNLKRNLATTFAVLAISSSASAALISDGTWDGWTVATSEDQEGNFNYVNPGYGGQAFDAEHLLYKIDGSVLSIGLQTGFDVIDSHQLYSGVNYWAGDLALSFDGVTLGDDSSYEYAIDFGKDQCGWSQRGNANCGTNNVQNLNNGEGLYRVTSWNNDVYKGHHVSDPFAMATYSAAYQLDSNEAGKVGTSYFRQVSIDLNDIGMNNITGFDAHWTMSCGNDAIDASASVSVPEPSSIALLALGIVGLGVLRKRAQ